LLRILRDDRHVYSTGMDQIYTIILAIHEINRIVLFLLNLLVCDQSRINRRSYRLVIEVNDKLIEFKLLNFIEEYANYMCDFSHKTFEQTNRLFADEKFNLILLQFKYKILYYPSRKFENQNTHCRIPTLPISNHLSLY
jgi:hypothetical protein